MANRRPRAQILLWTWLPLMAACGGDSTSGAEPAGPEPASLALQQACAEVVNSFRTTLPQPALAVWSDSARCFARQAEADDRAGVGHANFGVCGERAQNTCPGWSSGASDSAQVATLRQCATAMWNEGPGADYMLHGHYINMANPAYTMVGCGFHREGNTLWINMDFR